MTPSLNSIMSRLHARHLRLLIELDEHRSLLGAASSVGLTQPGASKALQEIETTFGTVLFNRTNRGLEPTAAGHCAIRYARVVQTDISNLRHDLDAILRGVGGRLAVGAIMGAVPLLMRAVSQLASIQPQMSFEIIEDTSQSLLAQIESGRLDVALCRTSVSNTPQLFSSRFVQDETLAVIANIDHPLKHAQNLNLADLAESRWIVYRANMPMRVQLEREFHDAGLRFPLHLVETTSILATLSLLQNSPDFVALVSIDVARQCAMNQQVRILPLTMGSVSDPYELVTRKGSQATPAMDKLAELLLSHGAHHNDS
ncbi:LysR family transcriptional regulator [Pseudomonas sp. 5FOS]|jgi:DNA-binding transcriptional LysR family regulator|uniref:LysR family transcriptional regulator n=1 Tax=unclassified Pseudomonas TaxID=196821 RepID=UPI001A9ECC50|nr:MULTISPECIES: LysR family transcriptional regulator [unclassified Pseudomonas]MCE5990000.1 LysR family transcriptional regulator [Pseudomonas sp. LM20]MCE5995205.1 LysR family transcriptional regulator [Pseudomonas sp. KCA11]UMY63658.1 LysR family transcriptional regulator [Pseudomonas sp. LS.1a]